MSLWCLFDVALMSLWCLFDVALMSLCCRFDVFLGCRCHVLLCCDSNTARLLYNFLVGVAAWIMNFRKGANAGQTSTRGELSSERLCCHRSCSCILLRNSLHAIRPTNDRASDRASHWAIELPSDRRHAGLKLQTSIWNVDYGVVQHFSWQLQCLDAARKSIYK